MNKYWKYDEFYESWNLYFTQFYDDEVIISFAKDNECGWFEITFQKEHITTDDILESKTIEEAKEECEYKVREYIQDQVSYYEDMLEKFEEE